MTKSELGEVISKVFSLYIFVKFVRAFVYSYLPFYIATRGVPDMAIKEVGILHASMALFEVILIAVFWFGAKCIGQLIAGDKGDKEVSLFSSENIMVPVFVAMGCLLIVQSIPEVSQLVSYVLLPQGQSVYQSAVPVAVHFVLALFFIFGAKGLQSIVLHFRGMK